MKTVFEKDSTKKIATVTASVGVGILILGLIIRFLLDQYVFGQEDKYVAPVQSAASTPAVQVPSVPSVSPSVGAIVDQKFGYFALTTTPTAKIAVDVAGGEDYRVAPVYYDFDYRLHSNVHPKGVIQKSGRGTNTVDLLKDTRVTHVWMSVDTESDELRQVVFRKFTGPEPEMWWEPDAQ
jgi:hypothetical protein